MRKVKDNKTMLILLVILVLAVVLTGCRNEVAAVPAVTPQSQVQKLAPSYTPVTEQKTSSITTTIQSQQQITTPDIQQFLSSGYAG